MVAELELGLEDEILVTLLRGQKRIRGGLLFLGRADDRAAVDMPQFGISLPAVEIRAIEQRNEFFLGRSGQGNKTEGQSDQRSEPWHGGGFLEGVCEKGEEPARVIIVSPCAAAINPARRGSISPEGAFLPPGLKKLGDRRPADKPWPPAYLRFAAEEAKLMTCPQPTFLRIGTFLARKVAGPDEGINPLDTSDAEHQPRDLRQSRGFFCF